MARALANRTARGTAPVRVSLVTLCLALGVMVQAPNGVVQADEEAPRVSYSLQAIEGQGPWRFEIAITSHQAQEVAVDRRLLELTVRPEGTRRRFVCRHPDAPRRGGVTEEMRAAQVHREWFDLRMYCSGNALRALRNGTVEIESRFGYRTRGRDRFVVRTEGERRPPHRVDGPTLSWSRQPVAATEAPLRIGMADFTARGAIRFRPSVRAGLGTRPYVYLRDDQYSFEVDGPTGQVDCSRDRVLIVPIRDRYRRLGQRPVRAVLASNYFCPDETFKSPGIYEVTPVLTLPHGGERYGLDALTGVFTGSTAVIRVRSSSYHPQPMDTLPEAEEPSRHEGNDA